MLDARGGGGGPGGNDRWWMTTGDRLADTHIAWRTKDRGQKKELFGKDKDIQRRKGGTWFHQLSWSAQSCRNSCSSRRFSFGRILPPAPPPIFISSSSQSYCWLINCHWESHLTAALNSLTSTACPSFTGFFWKLDQGVLVKILPSTPGLNTNSTQTLKQHPICIAQSFTA